MMKRIKLYVELKIPDTAAITAFHTLERMGFDSLKALKRHDYYEFEVEGDEKRFFDKISKTDILVNANKHKAIRALEAPKSDYTPISVLVQSIEDDAAGLLNTLKTRLGFSEIKSMKKGVLWTLFLDTTKETAKSQAEKIASALLANRHYQQYEIV